MTDSSTSSAMELSEYVAVLWRRKALIFGPMLLLSVIAAIVAFVLPPVYRSGATILIESPEIPEEFVSTTVTVEQQERLQNVMLRLLTHKNLWAIIEKLDLYPEERNLLSPGAVVSIMRSNVGMEIIQYAVTAPEGAKTPIVTYPLRVSFEADTPETAEKVANEVADLFLSENRRARAERATAISQFLAEEGDKFRSEIADLESKLALFKRNYADQLPEQKAFNLRIFEQTEQKVEQTERTIRTLEDRRMNLESQLAITDPYKQVFTDRGTRVQTGSERFSALMGEFLRVSSIYSPDHPDVKKLRREIASLEGQMDRSSGASQLVSKVTLLREQLSKARQKYTEEHPDIRKLKQSIAAIERQLREYSRIRTTSTYSTPLAPDNPTYVSLKTQLDTVNANLDAERQNLYQLRTKREQFEARLFKTPTVERDYLALTRDYDNAVKKYNEIKDKQHEARLGLELESDSKGERLTLVERARIPGKPYKPNRRAIILIGVVLGFISGIGTASVAEYLDHTVRGAKGVAAVFQAPPLAAIPYVRNSNDIALARKHTLMLAGVFIVAILAGLAFLYIYLNPIEKQQELAHKVDARTAQHSIQQ